LHICERGSYLSRMKNTQNKNFTQNQVCEYLLQADSVVDYIDRLEILEHDPRSRDNDGKLIPCFKEFKRIEMSFVSFDTMMEWTKSLWRL
jgi:hypothetical protein